MPAIDCDGGGQRELRGRREAICGRVRLVGGCGAAERALVAIDEVCARHSRDAQRRVDAVGQHGVDRLGTIDDPHDALHALEVADDGGLLIG